MTQFVFPLRRRKFVRGIRLKLLGFGLLAVSAGFFGAPECCAQEKVDKDALIKAYSQLESEKFIGEYETQHKGFCDEKLIVHTSQVVKCGAKGLVINTTDHLTGDEQKAIGLNQNYAFDLRREKGKKWLVDMVSERSNPLLKSQIDARQRSVRRQTIPVLFHKRLTDFLQTPSFQIREVGAEARNGLNLVIVEFSCDDDTSAGRKLPEIKSGKMNLMRDFGLLPVEATFEVKYPADNTFSSVSKSFEYDLTDPQRPLCTKTIQELTYKNVPDKEHLRDEFEYKYRNTGIEPHYFEFKMQAFGLDEPVFKHERGQ